MNDKATNPLGGKKRVVWFGLALLVIAGGVSWFIDRSREPMPMYKGKPLTYWLECNAGVNRTGASEEAIQAIGTNAVPILVRLLQKRDSSFKVKVLALLTNQSLIRLNLHPAEYFQFIGLRGVWALGSNGYPTVPELIRLYQATTNDGLKLRIVLLLGHLGPSGKNAVPFLASLLPDRKDPRRLMNLMALMALEDIHSSAPSAIPALTACLNDPNRDVRDMAIKVLKKYGSPVPALLKCLDDSSPQVRKSAAQALQTYQRGDIRQTIPPLLNLLHDKNPNVREAAYQALLQIDPKAAAPFEYGGVHGQVITNHADSVR